VVIYLVDIRVDGYFKGKRLRETARYKGVGQKKRESNTCTHVHMHVCVHVNLYAHRYIGFSIVLLYIHTRLDIGSFKL